MLEKLEMKINNWKQKQNPKVLGVAMFTIFGAVVLFAMNMANVYGREKQTTTDIYNRTMYEIITNVNNIDILVAKIRITTTPEYNITSMSEVLSEVSTAKDNLSALPLNQNSLKNISKFFAQITGYFESLIKKLANGYILDSKDHENLKKINEVASNLNNTLKDIYQKLNSGKIKWDEVEKVATKELTKDKNSLKLEGINKMSDSLDDYEGLIYDGAFSNHLETKEPKSLASKEISVENAAKKVEQCVENIWKDSKNKKKIENVIYNGESKGKLELYMFEVKLKDVEDKIDVQITKKDGKLQLLMYDRKVEKKKISIKQAKELGEKYLVSLGLNDLEPTYYLETENMMTINYAAKQNDVILYPDLIKVKIAMDTGEICSVECTGYIYNHIERTNIEPEITEEQAKKVLSKDMKIEYSGLAIIPTDSMEEVLTYEFKGSIDNRKFLIYVNAKTAKEENVLVIIDTKGGILTM